MIDKAETPVEIMILNQSGEIIGNHMLPRDSVVFS